MLSPTLATMSNDLRRAAGRRAYADVERLAVSLCTAAAGEARSLPPGDPRIREIAAWLDGQLETTGILLRIARATCADEIRRIPFLKRYLRQRTPPAAQVRLDA
jgi:hypothetical protein